LHASRLRYIGEQVLQRAHRVLPASGRLARFKSQDKEPLVWQGIGRALECIQGAQFSRARLICRNSRSVVAL
jgi:hypothetical protein